MNGIGSNDECWSDWFIHSFLNTVAYDTILTVITQFIAVGLTSFIHNNTTVTFNTIIWNPDTIPILTSKENKEPRWWNHNNNNEGEYHCYVNRRWREKNGSLPSNCIVWYYEIIIRRVVWILISFRRTNFRRRREEANRTGHHHPHHPRPPVLPSLLFVLTWVPITHMLEKGDHFNSSYYQRSASNSNNYVSDPNSTTASSYISRQQDKEYNDTIYIHTSCTICQNNIFVTIWWQSSVKAFQTNYIETNTYSYSFLRDQFILLILFYFINCCSLHHLVSRKKKTIGSHLCVCGTYL